MWSLVNSCPGLCLWLGVNYPVYLVPVWWVPFGLVYSLLPSVPVCQSCPAIIKDYYFEFTPRLRVPCPSLLLFCSFCEKSFVCSCLSVPRHGSRHSSFRHSPWMQRGSSARSPRVSRVRWPRIPQVRRCPRLLQARRLREIDTAVHASFTSCRCLRLTQARRSRESLACLWQAHLEWMWQACRPPLTPVP